ncbi:hypothetical protein [Actinomadura coerulea]|uniref:hypothetical protein n=1 Tax=Actinomadura coerulea TaxID=46159 RepID=UPI003445D0EC
MHPTTVEAHDTYPTATEKIIGDKTRPVPTYDKHLYVIPPGKQRAGRFPVDTSRSSLETDVLERKLSATTLLGRYRNPGSGRHALAVPYQGGDKTLLMHPDSLFSHEDGDDIVMDIIDPHRHDLADAAPKWSALARYTQDHADRVRRVLAFKITDGELRALDLTANGIAEKMQTASKDLLEALFASGGFSY